MKIEKNGFILTETDTAGAIVTELDLSGEIPSEVAEDLREAWFRYGVLVFPKLGDSSDRHVKLSRVFGELEVHPNPFMRMKDNPELIEIGGIPETKGPPVVVNGELLYGFLYFHQDTFYTPSIAKGAVLRMIKTSEKGGQTVFSDLEKAYEALPEDLKRLCEQRQVVYSYNEVPEPLWGMRDLHVRFATAEEAEHMDTPRPDWPLVVHPLVNRHPVTGRRSLLMSPAGFVAVYGMDKSEGDEFFERIASHATRPEFCYRTQWQEDDLLLWDNRRTMHWATGYPANEKRIIQRTTLKGEMRTGKLLTDLSVE